MPFSPRRSGGDDRARLALDVYLHRLRAGIAAMTTALGGLDVLVFTGGVGERAPAIRAAAAAGLGFLGVEVDSQANRVRGRRRGDLRCAGAPVRTLVITSREDLEIAHQTRDALSGP